MDDSPTPQNDWQAGCAGQIGGMLSLIRRRRRNRFLLRAGSVAGVLLLAALSPLLLSSAPDMPVDEPAPIADAETDTKDSPEVCGITCQELKKSARDWLAGELPETESNEIEAHLKECPHCPKFVNELRLDDDQSSLMRPPFRLVASH